MAVIYLKHPVHGAKVAISHDEAEYDMENGWEEFDPVLEVVKAEVEAPQPVVNELQPKRRGRPPRQEAAT